MNTQNDGAQKRNAKTGMRHRWKPAGLVCWGCLALLPVLGLLLTGCQTTLVEPADAPLYPPPAADPGAAAYTTNNLLEGDVVSINFQYSTNFNALQKISLDGTLNLQGVGLVKAAGKSTLQLQTELTRLYQGQVKDDPITIKVVTPESAVYVAGAVTRPGKIPLERPMTVLEAVMEAGGYDPYRADLSHVLVLRVENGRQKSYRVNLRRILQGRDDAPFYLKPFDVIQVTTKTFNF
jgi:polysaccharide export outer membrane protein